MYVYIYIYDLLNDADIISDNTASNDSVSLISGGKNTNAVEGSRLSLI
jgi:hypothetical protein